MRTLPFIIAALIALLIYLMVRPPPQTPTDQPSTHGTSTAGTSTTQSAGDGGVQGKAAHDAAVSYNGPTVSISMVYSPEKERWIRYAVSEFTRHNPAFQISLTGMSSFDAGAAIIDGTLRPTVWSPAANIVVKWFEAEWEFTHAQRTRSGPPPASPLDIDDLNKLEPLFRSPITMLAWESVIPGTHMASKSWRELSTSMLSLLNIDVTKEGVLHLGHTNPSRSSSGLQAFYMLALSYFNYETLELTLDDLKDPELIEYLRQWETQVSDFPRSTDQLTSNMFRFGPTRYRIIMTYENLAIERRIQSWDVPGPFGKLLVGYPGITMWADHPVVMLRLDPGDEHADAKRAAARAWIDFLRSEEMQTKAIEHGFRPVTIQFDVNDPDSILYRVPGDDELRVLEPPSGEVLRELVRIWHSFQTGQTQLKIGESGRYQPPNY